MDGNAWGNGDRLWRIIASVGWLETSDETLSTAAPAFPSASRAQIRQARSNHQGQGPSLKLGPSQPQLASESGRLTRTGRGANPWQWQRSGSGRHQHRRRLAADAASSHTSLRDPPYHCVARLSCTTVATSSLDTLSREGLQPSPVFPETRPPLPPAKERNGRHSLAAAPRQGSVSILGYEHTLAGYRSLVFFLRGKIDQHIL